MSEMTVSERLKVKIKEKLFGQSNYLKTLFFSKLGPLEKNNENEQPEKEFSDSDINELNNLGTPVEFKNCESPLTANPFLSRKN